MVVLVKFFGIVIVAVGAIFLLKPDAMNPYMNFWIKGKRIYGGGVLSTIFGIIFLLAASQCRLAWIVAIVGIWGIIKGILLFVLGPEKLKSWIDWWKGRPVGALRLLALLALAIGALIIYAV